MTPAVPAPIALSSQSAALAVSLAAVAVQIGSFRQMLATTDAATAARLDNMNYDIAKYVQTIDSVSGTLLRAGK